MRLLPILLALLATAAHAAPSAPDLRQVAAQQDPLQRCAAKALRGDFGPLKPWQRLAYQKVIDKHITVQGGAKRTTYCLKCAGRTCADGSLVRDGICAASPNIKMHSIIWLASDGLLKVCDRGGWVKVGGRFTRAGETANVDVWRERCVGDCWCGPGTRRRVPWAVISR